MTTAKLFILACFVAPFVFQDASGNISDLLAGRELAFDQFIIRCISDFKNNLKDGNFNPSNFNFNRTLNESSDTAQGNTTGTVLQDIRLFNPIVNSSLQDNYIQIYLNFPILNYSGNYSLEGLASSVIIVNGNGPFSIQTEAVNWHWDAILSVNVGGYASINGTRTGHRYSSLNATFEGIIGEDVIGELIRNYLVGVGAMVYQHGEIAAVSDFGTKLFAYLNNVLQTITVDEILHGTNPSSTTTTQMPNSTTTTQSPPTGSTTRPDVIIDIGSDLAGSGWVIPSTAACGYATNINGFFCNGSPVEIIDPISGVGFWMSPCVGLCEFHYNNVDNRDIAILGFRVLYNDDSIGSRIIVDFEHSSGTTHLEFSRKDGVYNEVDFRQFGMLKNVNVTMENNGPRQFAVLDVLSVRYN